MNTPECQLACGCWKRIRLDLAKVNSTDVCKYHGEQTIIASNYYEWHVRCQEYGCSFGRWVGQNEHAARLVNGKHATTKDHLGGVQYDRITWDGRGAIYRHAVDRNARTTVKPPPQQTAEPVSQSYRTVTFNPDDYAPPPF